MCRAACESFDMLYTRLLRYTTCDWCTIPFVRQTPFAEGADFASMLCAGSLATPTCCSASAADRIEMKCRARSRDTLRERDDQMTTGPAHLECVSRSDTRHILRFGETARDRLGLPVREGEVLLQHFVSHEGAKSRDNHVSGFGGIICGDAYTPN
jgi:hypothetical protein